MERIINLKIKRLPEGVYLATSEEVQGLVAQGRTIKETIEIAQDVAKSLLDLQKIPSKTQNYENEFELSLIVGD